MLATIVKGTTTGGRVPRDRVCVVTGHTPV